MLAPREIERRDQRRIALSIKPTLTSEEVIELERLEQWHAATWRKLPRMIDSTRAKLMRLQRLADHLGIGPC